MEDTGYFILLSLRSSAGFVEYGKFDLGRNARFAAAVFDQLLGDNDVSEQDVLQMEFKEMRQNLPVNVKMRNCTLDQLAENCKLITREIFKARNIGKKL